MTNYNSKINCRSNVDDKVSGDTKCARETRRPSYTRCWLLLRKGDQGRAIRDIVPRRKLFSNEQVSWFRAKNANGCHIYGRPNSTRYILIDDVKQEGIRRLKQDGLTPTAITETSPDNFQVWIAASRDELPIPVATQLAKLLELEAGINWIVAKSVDKLTEMVADQKS